MNDFPEPKTIMEFVFGGFVTLLGWLGRVQHRRLTDLEQKSVTREELKEITTQMRDDRVKMHEQNREDLQYIRERVDSIADRQ